MVIFIETDFIVRQSHKNKKGEILPFGFSQRKKFSFFGFSHISPNNIELCVQIVAKAFTLFISIRWLKPNGKDFLFYVFADSIVSAIAMDFIDNKSNSKDRT